MHDLGRLGLNRGGNDRIVVANHGREHAAEEIEVTGAIARVDPAAIAMIEFDRLGVIRVHK